MPKNGDAVSSRKQEINQRLTSVDGRAPVEKIAKHVKMASNAFVFYRGSSQLFYADLKSGLLSLPAVFSDVPHTMLMGDCHLSNFGFLTEEGSHGDRIIFAPNDFDDACVGQAVWDIARFAISLKLAADYGRQVAAGQVASDEKYLGKATVDPAQTLQAMQAFIDAYMAVCQLSINDSELLSQAIDDCSELSILTKPYQKALRRSAGGQEFTVKSSLAKAVQWDASTIKFKTDNTKFTVLSNELYQDIEHTFAPYVDDHILDIVERIGSGTGSLNMSRYYLLVGPANFQGTNDLALCHIVEVKKQRKAAPLYHFTELSPVNRLNPAHLTVQCQRRMQRSPDLVLDEVEWQGDYWLVRSRHHAKVGIDPEDVVLGKKAAHKQGFIAYANVCGEALALAHCRGDRRSSRFETQMLKALTQSKVALLETCLQYAKQVEQDTEHLVSLLG